MEDDGRIPELVKIARLYYLEGLGQRDIAKKMHTSVARISRSIAKARSLGIVRITVEAPDRGLSELEIEVERTFGLDECLLVETSPTPEVMFAEMAAKLFGHLDRILTGKSNVGVSWGRTLKVIAESLPPRRSPCSAVIPIVGAVGQIETGIFPNSIARLFAEKLGGSGYLVNVPALVDSGATRTSLLSDGSFAPVAALWENLDVALLSVSSLSQGASVRDLQVLPENLLNQAAVDGAAFVANFLFFDRDGRRIDTKVADQIIALQESKLRSIPHRIVAAAGSEKTDAVYGALRGGLGNVLVSDRETAEALIQRDTKSKKLR